MNRPYIRRIWGELHWLCFVFIFLALSSASSLGETVRRVEFLEDLSLYVFFAPWLIFVVVDKLITGKLTVFPWKRKDAVETIEDQNKIAKIKSLWGEFKLTVFPKKRKDADKKVVNEERDSY